jgi:hypothetical protein
MVNKAEHRYKPKASVKGRYIASTQLWSKYTTVGALTIIGESLYMAEVSTKDNYCTKIIISTS